MTKNEEPYMIIPMNPHKDYSGGSTAGSIIAQKWFAERKGKVIISFDKSSRYTNSSEKPRLGFFYDSSKGKVTHRFSIVDITDDNGIGRYEKEGYLPPWRRLLYEERRPTDSARTWLVMKDIFRLNEPQELAYFGKKRCQSFIYTRAGSELPYFKKKSSVDELDEFIEDIVYRCATSKAEMFLEDHLELIMWALIVKNKAEYLKRQPSIDGKRLDILLKTPKGEHIVIELKREIADKEALTQLRKYMKTVMKEEHPEKLRGVIIARHKSPDLQNELEKRENADISFIPYRFAFNSKPIEKAIFQ